MTLTGAGGAGKTRLAIEVAGRMTSEFPDGVWYVDLAPITHPEVVPLAVARALGLPDQPGSSITETLLRFVRDRHMLLVLDNCEHLLEASAALVNEMLARLLKGDDPRDESRTPLGARRGELAGAVAVAGRRGDRACSPTARAAPGRTSQ